MSVTQEVPKSTDLSRFGQLGPFHRNALRCTVSADALGRYLVPCPEDLDEFLENHPEINKNDLNAFLDRINAFIDTLNASEEERHQDREVLSPRILGAFLKEHPEISFDELDRLEHNHSDLAHAEMAMRFESSPQDLGSYLVPDPADLGVFLETHPEINISDLIAFKEAKYRDSQELTPEILATFLQVHPEIGIDGPAHVEGAAMPLDWAFEKDGRKVSKVAIGEQAYRDKGSVELEDLFTVVDIRDFRLIVFDIDGLIIDSEGVVLECILRAAEEMVAEDKGEPFEFSPEQVEIIKDNCFKKAEPIMAANLRKTLRAMDLWGPNISEGTDPDFLARLVERRLAIFEEKLDAGEIKFMPGAKELLGMLVSLQRDVQIGFCTGNSRPFVELLFKHFAKHIDGFEEAVDVRDVLCANEIPEGYGKPDAYATGAIASYFRMKPEGAVMLGDRKSDMVSALKAGYGLILVVAEDTGTGSASFADPNDPMSFPTFLRIYADAKYPDAEQDPDRVKILGSLERIAIQTKDGLWMPPAYWALNRQLGNKDMPVLEMASWGLIARKKAA